MNIVQCLFELPIVRGDFTLAVGSGPNRVCTHLDRVFGSIEWVNCWPTMRPRLLPGHSSDHNILFLEFLVIERGETFQVLQ